MKKIKSFPLIVLSAILTIIALIEVQTSDRIHQATGFVILATAWLVIWLPLAWGIVEEKGK